MADLTPDLQVRLSWGLLSESFHALQSLSVSFFHVILGLPGPRFPSTCMSKAVLIAPLEHSTCPYHRSLLSFRMRSRSSMPSSTSRSLDLVVTMSCGLTLQICLIIALSFRCRRWRFSLKGYAMHIRQIFLSKTRVCNSTNNNLITLLWLNTHVCHPIFLLCCKFHYLENCGSWGDRNRTLPCI